MKIYQLNFQQIFPVTLPQVWDFFSSPFNLEAITPKDMMFEVTSGQSTAEQMYPGMIITYKVSPLMGIKLNWVTEITQVEREKYFIDEQRYGPFKFWHHQHHFTETASGVEMRDILTYALPLGFLGSIAHEMFVKQKLQEIFKFRRQKTIELFGES